MSDLTLVLSSLKSRWLNSLLSVLLTAFGVMLALLIIQFGHHVQRHLSVDGKGIDIVIGAKGSPLQLVLSSVYHVDIPTGNIPYEEAQKWMRHPQIKSTIPLALGDNWQGYRIAGTTPAYIDHYKAQLTVGHIWNKPFEAVAGAAVGLKAGEKFSGAHGLMAGGHVHADEQYKITGVLKPTGTVLDRLILTSLDSVLTIHGLESVEHHEHEPHHEHHHESAGRPEITALLLKTKSPIANINLPRQINRESALQAANPAFEMARLTSMLGLGSQSLTLLSALLITIAALSIFAGLAGSLENRLQDLAVLRAVGYSRRRLLKIVTLEGLMIVVSGLVLGTGMGLGLFMTLAQFVDTLRASHAGISFTPGVFALLLAVIGVGLLAAMLPAWRASRVDVAQQLSRNG